MARFNALPRLVRVVFVGSLLLSCSVSIIWGSVIAGGSDQHAHPTHCDVYPCHACPYLT